MTNITMLFRTSLAEENEEQVANKYFDVVGQRTEIRPDTLVVGRYSVLPYYAELEKDLANNGSKLVNTHAQHLYAQNIDQWYYDLQDITPTTWFDISAIPTDYQGSCILKGITNSRKQLWTTHMFAETRADIMDVYGRLLDDTMLSHQGIVIREYVDLIKYHKDVVGMPIAKEFRLFVYDKKVISSGFYWSSQVDLIKDNLDPSQVPSDFVQEVINRVGSKCNFYTLDVGQKTDGSWTVIELGDAQMAGPSCNDLDNLYEGLCKAVRRRVALDYLDSLPPMPLHIMATSKI